jgi:catechol 2,3-dioxygenase-like lactoylglutathione lyase family enzyme
LIIIEDIEVSRRFYGQLLGLKQIYDFGPNVEFEGHFSIHLRAHYQTLLPDAEKFPITKKAHNSELYFETGELERIHKRLKDAGVEFLHEVQEQPWGQRCMRLYDPDGHILEIGETMEGAVQRLHNQGMTIDRITEKSGMPREFVERALQETSASDQAGSV